ncbi:MAG: S8 family serine peptidase [Candidatus Berkelbacteria bacterium]|nr:S8 family serine peptidase [Candidatus Berkelbacteria bacterium]
MKFFGGKRNLVMALVAVLVLSGAGFASYGLIQKKISADTDSSSEFAKQDKLKPEYIPGSFLVKVKSDQSSTSKSLKDKGLGNLTFTKLYNSDTVKTKSIDKDSNLDKYLVAKLPPETTKMPNELQELFKQKNNGQTFEEARNLRVLEALQNDPTIEAVSPNYLRKTSWSPDDPYYHQGYDFGTGYDAMWGMKNLSMEGAWDNSKGKDIVVAVIDTGVDYNHEDLKDNILKDQSGNIIGQNFTTDDTAAFMDNFGHGTHVAGTIAAVGNNGVGVVGVAPEAKIMPVKVLGDNGSGSDVSISQGIIFAADNGAKVINMSLGGIGFDQIIEDALSYAVSKGVVIAVAAGNDNYDANVEFPASSQNVVTVAAYDPYSIKADFSNFGPKIDVSAPGVDILSTVSSTHSSEIPDNKIIDGKYARLSGTSMATPHVSGLLALIASKNPSWSRNDIIESLKQKTSDMGTKGIDDLYGFGKPNISQSLALTTPPILPTADIQNLSEVYNTDFSITGVAGGNNFANYTLDAHFASRVGNNPTEYFSVSSSSAPKNQIANLGKFSAGKKDDGFYYVRLIDKNKLGYQNRIVKKFYLATDQVAGFPAVADAISFFPIHMGSNQKGLISHGYGTISIFSADGKQLKKKDFNDDQMIDSFMVSDVNGDGKDEIVMTLYTFNTSSWQHKINILDQDFNVISQISTEAYAGYYLASYDFNGDGISEIIFNDAYYTFSSPMATKFFKIKVADKNGNIIASRDMQTTKEQWVGCNEGAIGDVNNDGKTEVALSCRKITNGNESRHIVLLDNNLNIRWSTRVGVKTPANYGLSSEIELFDINQDKNLEIIQGTPYYFSSDPMNDTTQISFIDSSGKTIKSFSQKRYILSLTPYLWNNDIFLAVNDLRDKGVGINLLNDSGKSVSGWPYLLRYDKGGGVARLPVVFDYNNDGNPEIFVTVNDMYLAGMKSGKIFFKKVINSLIFYPLLDDINMDGKIEMMIGGSYDYYYRDYLYLPGIYAYKTEASATAQNLQWPMYKHDPQRTNNGSNNIF